MTGTVRVDAHDLHRLLLEFRAQLERHERPVSYRGGWQHACDYDKSFERLADIIDANLATDGDGPDPRTRCRRDLPVYDWPEDPGPLAWVHVTAGSMDGQTRPRLRHLVPAEGPRRYRTLCGFRFATEDVATSGGRYPRCVVCARERRVRGLVDPDLPR